MKQASECIEWQGCRNKNGYGQRRYKGKTYLSHRVAYEEKYGEIPDGLCVLHKCDNPPCTNTDHLFLGTMADNTRDMIEKGRFKTGVSLGEKHGISVLTNKNVMTIRELSLSGIPQRTIAKIMKCSQTAVSSIITGKTWSWLT